MNKNISKNIRTHRLILRDGREFAITTEQYKSIRADKENSKRTDPFTLKDCDTGKILFDGEFGAISEFREIENNYRTGINWICEYGGRHPLHLPCDCANEYNNFSCAWVLPAMRYLGFKVDNSKNFTTEMKQKLRQATKNPSFLKEVIEFYRNLYSKTK